MTVLLAYCVIGAIIATFIVVTYWGLNEGAPTAQNYVTLVIAALFVGAVWGPALAAVVAVKSLGRKV